MVLKVLLRNQIAHVKAERDILKEADNEWIVKLFYRFFNDFLNFCITLFLASKMANVSILSWSIFLVVI